MSTNFGEFARTLRGNILLITYFIDLVLQRQMFEINDLKSQIQNGCRFCNPPEKERILFETKNFYVMVSLGPIIEGYLLIVSKSHWGACLHVPEDYLEEFVSLKQKVKQILIEVYGGCIFYEHGKIGTSLTAGDDHHHCFHAHLHCIPTNININDSVKNEFEQTRLEDIAAAHQYVLENQIGRYLYIEDEHVCIYQPHFAIRSQYLRYKLSELLNLKDRWNWVNNQNWQLLEESITRLKPYFNE